MLDVRRLQGALGGRRAAARSRPRPTALRLTQSAVSQHVAALEREVGLPLVERGTRPVELTEAGHALTGTRPGSSPGSTAPSRSSARSPAGATGGCASAASRPRSPRSCRAAFARFRRRHPDVTLTVVDDHLQRLLPRLEAGELDLALIYDHEALPEIARARPRADARCSTTPSGPCCPRATGSPAGAARSSLADLAGEPWIGGAPASAWYRIVRHACRRGRLRAAGRLRVRRLRRGPGARRRRARRRGHPGPRRRAPAAGGRGARARRGRARAPHLAPRGRATAIAAPPSARCSRACARRRARRSARCSARPTSLGDQLELPRLVAQRPQVDALAAGLGVAREELGAVLRRDRRRPAREARRDLASGAEPGRRRARDRPRPDPSRPRSTSSRARSGSRPAPARAPRARAPGRAGVGEALRRRVVGGGEPAVARPRDAREAGARAPASDPQRDAALPAGRARARRRAERVVARLLGQRLAPEQRSQHGDRLVESLPALLERDADGVVVALARSPGPTAATSRPSERTSIAASALASGNRAAQDGERHRRRQRHLARALDHARERRRPVEPGRLEDEMVVGRDRGEPAVSRGVDGVAASRSKRTAAPRRTASAADGRRAPPADYPATV